MTTKKVAIVGASGYSGEELVRLLLNHPHAELVAVTSRQNAGQTLAQVFPKFASHPKSKTLRFVEPNAELLAKQADVVFLALPHGVAAEYAVPLMNAGCIVIDLSADFRLKSAEIYKEFYAHDHPAPELLAKAVYGLPEVYREQIKQASLIASPGCYPTSILLPTIPLLQSRTHQAARHHRRFHERRQRRGAQGGAGLPVLRVQRKRPPLRRAEAPAFVRDRGADSRFAAGTQVVIQFTPHLIPVNRGILTTLYLAPAEHFTDAAGAAKFGEKIAACYAKAYANEPFVRVARRQGVARHQERRRHERLRNRVAARSAHGPADRDERRGQPRQRRQRSGGAKHEHPVRLSRKRRGWFDWSAGLWARLIPEYHRRAVPGDRRSVK